MDIEHALLRNTVGGIAHTLTTSFSSFLRFVIVTLAQFLSCVMPSTARATATAAQPNDENAGARTPAAQPSGRRGLRSSDVNTQNQKYGTFYGEEKKSAEKEERLDQAARDIVAGKFTGHSCLADAVKSHFPDLTATQRKNF